MGRVVPLRIASIALLLGVAATGAAEPPAAPPPMTVGAASDAPAATAVPGSEPTAPPAAAAAPAPSAPLARFDASRPEVQRFVSEVAMRDAMSRRRLLRLLRKAQPQPKIIELMNRQPERVLQWWEYRQLFLTERRIGEGAQFWLDHRAALERIAGESGIPAEYLVAILGCETLYGRLTGRDRVLDSLATLAFDYPPRGEYFRGELEQFLLLTREEHLDPLAVKGSWSGAMGAPQFMPSAYRRYAVDASHNHRRDLWNDWSDVLASVANYLRQNGWQSGYPVLAAAHLDPAHELDAHLLDAATTVDTLATQGIRIDLSVPGSTPVTLIAAEQQDGPAYRVGFNNFRAIVRYNHSTRYAMAVNDLAQAIAERVHAGSAAAASLTSTSRVPPG